MKLRATVHSVLLAVALLVAGGAEVSAQIPAPPPPPPGPGGNVFFFRTFRLEDNKVVAGRPYSADATTAITQVLSDGNRIVRKETAKVYRDSMGRTRRDLAVSAIGPWSSGAPLKMASIFDPVAKVHYMLNLQEKKAFKMPPLPRGPVEKGRVAMGDRVFVARAGATGGGPAIMFAEKDAGLGSRTEQSLGIQEIGGVAAQGTRITETIPTGKIGNEKPIVITTERWYSPDLHVDVLVKHSDPRTGEVVYKLSNISREEPDPSLFQVPPDYKLEDGPMVLKRRLR